jgi:Ca2+-binding EF-hand superfamily protein|tara:strand:- start:690 stop:1079 length:390 start_codon:yes stop_codon:yes gene_type:complete
MVRNWFLIAVITLALQTNKPLYAENRNVVDQDRNGEISRNEAENFYRRVFLYIDHDNDQQLSASEFLNSYSNLGRQYSIDGFYGLIDQLDRNFDNFLDIVEYMTAAMNRYRASDMNGDGRVSIVEASNL